MRLWFLIGFGVTLGAAIFVLSGLQPPNTIRVAAGPNGGAYVQIATQYREILARDGIDLVLVETSGSVENAKLISSGLVDAAILQGGIEVENKAIEAIGVLFFEPMIFLAGQTGHIPSNPAQWRGLRINIGATGSGTAAAFKDFEAAVGLDPDANQQVRLSYAQAVPALIAGEIDIAVFVAPIDAPYLTRAYGEDAVRVMSLDYTEAISRRLKYATTVRVPAGAVSLLPVVPETPRILMALQARMAIAPDLHPALVNRLTMAAIELHSGRGMITDQGVFPSVDGVNLPVNNAARQLIINGPSIWHSWLPYWMASQVHRMVILLLPILFIFLPALRALPKLYAFAMRRRVWRHFPEIREIEAQLENVSQSTDLAGMDARLIELDRRLSQMKLPPSYRQTAYDARLNINLVRNRIAELRAGADSAEIIPA